MKIDRLIGITMNLLNRETVSAKEFAEIFEVSHRTIKRDMETLSAAGIPIKSTPGANGGYSVMEGFKLDGRLVSAEDQASIITALKGFLSAYDSNRYVEALDKVSSILPKQQNQHIFLDFGASGENNEIQAKLKTLEKAICDKKILQIFYVNAMGETSIRFIEPIAINYRWYAWYLLAYCQTKQDYRIFKLARISELQPAETTFSKKHDDPGVLLEQAFQGNGRKCLDITLLCKAEVKIQVCEYLGGKITETLVNGDLVMRLNVLEDERMWFAALLSFGDKVTVVKPEELKIRLMETAEKILSLYK